MYHNYVLQDVTHALPVLARDIMSDDAAEIGSRNGVTKELTHVGITLTHPTQREILIPERKASIVAQIAETMWVLSGRNDVRWLENYLPRAKDFSDDGLTWRAGYGPRIRGWHHENGRVDQLSQVVKLLRSDRSTRRAVMSIFDPEEDYADSKDIPCNNWITFLSRLGKLDMHVGVRSNDLIWGWSGINAFEWSALQEIVAGMLGIEVGSLHFSVTSLHIYGPHWNRASKISTAGAGPILDHSPRFNATGIDDVESLDALFGLWFAAEWNIRNGGVTDREIEEFPEPMLQSWLRVLRWWWTGDHSYLKPLAGTRLEYATHVSVQPPAHHPKDLGKKAVDTSLGLIAEGGAEMLRLALQSLGTATPPDKEAELKSPNALFVDYVIRLHLEKDQAYGDSWKRRGEKLGILANIARKIDRLGGPDTRDETSTDTAIDLLVYLAKYRIWLDDQVFHRNRSDSPIAANALIRSASRNARNGKGKSSLEEYLKSTFEELPAYAEEAVSGATLKILTVDKMIISAYELAFLLWETDPTNIVDETYRGADAD